MKNASAKSLLFVSLLLWAGVFVLVWLADAYPLVMREPPLFAHPYFYAVSVLFAIFCCIPIARIIYSRRERNRWFVLLPLVGLWGFPVFFDVSLSAVVVNGYLDAGAAHEHRVTLVRKNAAAGRWSARRFIVTDWRPGGGTVSITPVDETLFDRVAVGASLIALTRDGYLGAEWILKIDAP